MRLLFVADGRSPTALGWLKYWLEKGHETHLVSTFPCIPLQGLASFHVLPVAFGGMAGKQSRSTKNVISKPGSLGGSRELFRWLRYFLGPLSIPAYRQQFLDIIAKIQPDFVHALRIPFEGMMARSTPPGIPLVVSIWGNDITLHARGSFMMASLTRQVLIRADGLLADANRDLRLGIEWGFFADRPTLVLPGAGGIHLDEMIGSAPDLAPVEFPEQLPETPIVVNPRGQRPGSLRQDIFFQAIPLVLKEFPQTIFICPSLAKDVQAERWVDEFNLSKNTRLWPRLNQPQLWALFRKAQVFVSPSLHDGTPNSLLEAMACGCFPVVGDIESMREWIQAEDNGILVDANSPQSIAKGIIKALASPSLRATAKNKNALVIAERADYSHCMAMAEAFYQEILNSKSKKVS